MLKRLLRLKSQAIDMRTEGEPINSAFRDVYISNFYLYKRRLFRLWIQDITHT